MRQGAETNGSLKRVLYHTLDYYQGTQGFGPVETWSTDKAQALASNDEYSYGWSLFLGIGPAPPVFHVGKGVARGTGESSLRGSCSRTSKAATGSGQAVRGLAPRRFPNGVGSISTSDGASQSILFSTTASTPWEGQDQTATRLKGVHVGSGGSVKLLPLPITWVWLASA